MTLVDTPARETVFAPDEVRAFRGDGYVIARGLADPALCDRILSVARDHLVREQGPIEYEAELGYPGAPASLDAPGGHTVRRLLQAYDRDPVFRAWAMSPAVAVRLRQLMGPQVALARAHHNCVMTKQPHHSSVTGWHQDVRYWSFQRPELVSVWLALGREYPDNGCLSLIPGTHLAELDRSRFDEALFLCEDLAENRKLAAACVMPLLEQGDVLFFHCRTLHRAGANQTDATKFSLVYTYHSVHNRPLPATRSASLPSVAL